MFPWMLALCLTAASSDPEPAHTTKAQTAKPPVAKSEPAKLQAENARLAAENARLQAALAKAEGSRSFDIRTPADALEELKQGNLRFVEGRRTRTVFPAQDPGLRESLAKGQSPFAVIVTCSDSRLMDNFIFDQELGRLFTIREAGNCPDLQGIASVEYAVEHLGSKVVVVLGHTFCGAVKAVAEAHGKPLPGNLWSLQAAMVGLLESVPEDPNVEPAEHMRELERVNTLRQAQSLLARSEILRELVEKGKVRVLPALYDLSSGKVTVLDLPAAKASTSHH